MDQSNEQYQETQEENLNGSESYSGIGQSVDVNTEEVANPEEQSSAPERGPVPYDRFAEVNSERNQLKEHVAQLMYQMNSLTQSLTPKEQPVNNSAPQIETIEDLVSHVKKSVENDLRPVKETLRLEKIARGVEGYFSRNQDAANLRPEMDAYTATLPAYRQQAILAAIENGDPGVIDEIYYTVKAKKMVNNQGAVSNYARREGETIASNSRMRSIPKIDTSASDLMKRAIETNDFKDYFSRFAQENFTIKN